MCFKSIMDILIAKSYFLSKISKEIRLMNIFNKFVDILYNLNPIQMKQLLKLTLIFTLLYFMSCSVAKEKKESSNYVFYEKGKASWYGSGFNGKKTASGETFNMNKLTAAHKTLKFGTLVRVTNLNNNKSVIVRINDRGPFKKGRVIDLSKKAALTVDMINDGVIPVKLELVKK